MQPAIEIVPYTAEHEPAVRAFNGRLRAANLDPNEYSFRFSESHIPRWLPRQPGSELYQELFLAVDGQSMVRGGYVLKHQPFLVLGQRVEVGTYRLPISEGIIDRQYAIVGARLYRDALRRQPYLMGLGGGGRHSHIADFLGAAGWRTTSVPFWFRVVQPNAFLANISAYRNSALRRCAMDLLRFSGIGWLGIRTGSALLSRFRQPASIAVEIVPEFSGWADAIWERCRKEHSLIAVRDQQTLRVLYPEGNPRFIRLKVTRDQVPVGWAVLLNTEMAGHKQFGDMRVGTLVDCLAAPEDAPSVVACACAALEAGGADLMISNQASRAWGQALRRNGFLPFASNFPFFASPRLTELLQPFEEHAATFHLNRADGDGPIHL